MLRTLLRLGVFAPLVVGSLAIAHGAVPAGADSFSVTDPSDNAATPNTLRSPPTRRRSRAAASTRA